MNLMAALLETYNFAQSKGLINNTDIGIDGIPLAPIYHSTRRAQNDRDIFEITLDENSKPIEGRFLAKDEMIIFPITEESITRSGRKIAPHAICDELSYLAKDISTDKHSAYIDGIKNLLNYEEDMQNCKNFKIIGNYILQDTVMEDFLRFFLKGKEPIIDSKFRLTYEEINNRGKTVKRRLELGKVFITFKLENTISGDIPFTNDDDLHEFYIDYIKDKNAKQKNLSYCNLTGEKSYCVINHRGVMGNAKLISSNQRETYYGRFQKREDIYNISYEASQKIHNMLKFLIDDSSHSTYIGEGAYIVNWLARDLEKGGIDLLSEMEEEDFESDDFGGIEETLVSDLGRDISYRLGQYFLGGDKSFESTNDFYILIIEKVNDGRVAIKYFRKLSRSEAYRRAMDWYESTNWVFYDYRQGKSIYKSPSVNQLVDFMYGYEDDKGNLTCKRGKLKRKTIEKLISCILESQRLPRDMVKTTFYRLMNKQSYKKSWDLALSTACSLIKKYKYDYENYTIDAKKIGEVKRLRESRSFLYGKLMAAYEKIELDAVQTRSPGNSSQESSSRRITNADRLWSSMIRTPERTRFILESKLKPYMNILKRSQPGAYVFYDKLITEITLELIDVETNSKNALDEDFILGYYYQKNEFYTKREKTTEKAEV